jgi:hypothetical protein
MERGVLIDTVPVCENWRTVSGPEESPPPPKVIDDLSVRPCSL